MSTLYVNIVLMAEHKLITARDLSACSEVVELATQTLQSIAAYRARYHKDGYMKRLLDTGTISAAGYCPETSDAATQAAHILGVLASREFTGSHFFTSLAPLKALPGPRDLILCMTPDQFKPGLGPVFFGERGEIMAELPPEAANAYSHEYVVERQIIHRPSRASRDGSHEWLDTEPHDLLSGAYVIGGNPLPGDTHSFWG